MTEIDALEYFKSIAKEIDSNLEYMDDKIDFPISEALYDSSKIAIDAIEKLQRIQNILDNNYQIEVNGQWTGFEHQEHDAIRYKMIYGIVKGEITPDQLQA